MRPALAFLTGALGGLAVIVAIASCSDDDRPPNTGDVGAVPTSSGGTEAGTLHDSGGDAATPSFDASLCQTVPLGGAVEVFERRVEPPAPRGGALTNGTYFLWESQVFKPRLEDAGEDQPTESRTGIARQKAVVVADGMIAIAAAEGPAGGSVGAPVVTAGTYVVDGTNLVVSVACPSSSELTFGYTATDQGLVLFGANGEVDVYHLID